MSIRPRREAKKRANEGDQCDTASCRALPSLAQLALVAFGCRYTDDERNEATEGVTSVVELFEPSSERDALQGLLSNWFNASLDLEGGLRTSEFSEYVHNRLVLHAQLEGWSERSKFQDVASFLDVDFELAKAWLPKHRREMWPEIDFESARSATLLGKRSLVVSKFWQCMVMLNDEGMKLQLKDLLDYDSELRVLKDVDWLYQSVDSLVMDRLTEEYYVPYDSYATHAEEYATRELPFELEVYDEGGVAPDFDVLYKLNNPVDVEFEEECTIRVDKETPRSRSGFENHLVMEYARSAARTGLLFMMPLVRINLQKNTLRLEWGMPAMSDGSPRRLIYVLTVGGHLLISDPRHIHHSALSCGAPVLCAGRLIWDGARVLYADNRSGHYLPTVQAFKNAIRIMRHFNYLDERTIVPTIVDDGNMASWPHKAFPDHAVRMQKRLLAW